MSARDRIDHWMFEAYRLDTRSLAVARVLVGLYLVLYEPPPLRWMSTLPASYFKPPPGPLRLLPGIPSSAALTAVSIGISLASVAVLAGYRTRLASIVAGLLLFFADGLGYSFGQVHHGVTFLATVLVIMAATNWGGAFSVDALRSRQPTPSGEGWPLALAALLLGFLMLTAGLPKLATGWLDPGVLAVRAHVVHARFAHPDAALLGAFPAPHPWLWKPLDYLTLSLELGFVVAVWSPRVRAFSAAAVVFHFAVFASFGIDFTTNVVAFAVFFSWSDLVDRFESTTLVTYARRAGARLQANRGLVVVCTVGTGVALGLVAHRVGALAPYVTRHLSDHPARVATLLAFVVALPLALGWLARELRDLARIHRTTQITSPRAR